jgi:hypothetical protein
MDTTTMNNEQTNDLDDTPDERYARDLVEAAIALPVRALPMAHACLEALDAGAMPGRYQYGLMCVLRRLGNCAPTPGVPLLRAAQWTGAQPGARWDAAQCSPAWQTLKACEQDGYALAALSFMSEIARANTARLERAQAAKDEHVRRAQAVVDTATLAAS